MVECGQVAFCLCVSESSRYEMAVGMHVERAQTEACYAMKSKLMLATLTLTLGSASALFGQGIYRDDGDYEDDGYSVYDAPPPPQIAGPGYGYRSACPGPNYAWIDGFWNWGGSRYAWRGGYWAPRPYVSAYWNAPRYASGRYYSGYWGGGRNGGGRRCAGANVKLVYWLCAA